MRDISNKLEEELTFDDKRELNEYVMDHAERYEKLYQSVLEDCNFDFEVKFINH